MDFGIFIFDGQARLLKNRISKEKADNVIAKNLAVWVGLNSIQMFDAAKGPFLENLEEESLYDMIFLHKDALIGKHAEDMMFAVEEYNRAIFRALKTGVIVKTYLPGMDDEENNGQAVSKITEGEAFEANLNVRHGNSYIKKERNSKPITYKMNRSKLKRFRQRWWKRTIAELARHNIFLPEKHLASLEDVRKFIETTPLAKIE